ncbi:tRNA dihydrouridine synthase DusB [Solibacillus sp. FSL W7-1472]|uniref:tRNA-dihydrouridine synthase n=2 Tax=Solibacillus TaxID=648800 RepID=F2F161_SOLSS|nr:MULTISPECIES: tRNA dihydrouridine synthase DusB [Solibacillus]AMO87525.1 tRNA-dihydrouridine synthase [Solibacillus silvestris]EKB43758.1 putative tRNA-dihydrouridine synthase [Solibacillus isronensis B3W22]BAK14425.1 tRNA-dihydrouridine synthase [Solibacillus silvestris StLB046]
MSNIDQKPFQIGDIIMDNRVVLAPMAGICNSAFRLTVKEFGAGLVYAEMISDKALNTRNKKTLDMLYIDERENPMTLQIFGGDKENLVEAAKFVDKHTTADIIDINMGCPVNKIIKCEAGAKWLLDPNKIYEMVSAVVDAVDKPVSVKMRIGWDEERVFAVENAQAAERAGAAAIAMHGRTRVQMYEGKANWDVLAEVKKNISIPFIANGDVETPEDAKRILEHTKADGVMIGRAALGNPWMIYQTVKYLESGVQIPEPSVREKMDVCLLHFERLKALKGEKVAVREMRKHASWYLKGIRGNGKIRNAINLTETEQELRILLNSVADEYEEEAVIV